MGNLRKYKIYAALVLIIHLVLCFILFSKIHSLIESSSNPDNKSGYLLIILLIIIGVVFFSIIVLAINKKESEQFVKRDAVIVTDDEKSEEIIQEKEIKSTEVIDVDHYIKRIIPKNDSKLSVVKYTEKILSNFAKEFDIVQGLFFIREKNTKQFTIAGKYAYFGETDPESFNLGQTLSGQVAFNKTVLYLSEIPENYVTILSGLGSSSPRHLLIIPVIINNETIAIIELASFKEFKKSWVKLFEELAQKIGESISTYIS